MKDTVDGKRKGGENEMGRMGREGMEKGKGKEERGNGREGKSRRRTRRLGDRRALAVTANTLSLYVVVWSVVMPKIHYTRFLVTSP